MSIATIIDLDHRTDVKMFEFHLERRVVTLQSFEHLDHLCLYIFKLESIRVETRQEHCRQTKGLTFYICLVYG